MKFRIRKMKFTNDNIRYIVEVKAGCIHWKKFEVINVGWPNEYSFSPRRYRLFETKELAKSFIESEVLKDISITYIESL